MRAAFARRDIGLVYRILQRTHGFGQFRIGILTGQSQPEISAIINGQKVIAVWPLARIAEGLGYPAGVSGFGTLPVRAHGGSGVGSQHHHRRVAGW